MTHTTLLIAAVLSASQIVFPNFWTAWLAIGVWGVYFYALHEEFALEGNAQATTVVLIIGAMVAGGFALLGTVYFLMASAALLMVLGMRQILPKYFPAETSFEPQK